MNKDNYEQAKKVPCHNWPVQVFLRLVGHLQFIVFVNDFIVTWHEEKKREREKKEVLTQMQVFVTSCLSSAVSLTLLWEQRFIRMIHY